MKTGICMEPDLIISSDCMTWNIIGARSMEMVAMIRRKVLKHRPMVLAIQETKLGDITEEKVRNI